MARLCAVQGGVRQRAEVPARRGRGWGVTGRGARLRTQSADGALQPGGRKGRRARAAGTPPLRRDAGASDRRLRPLRDHRPVLPDRDQHHGRRGDQTDRRLHPKVRHRGAMKAVLALDQGTTSSRAIVFNEAGAVEAVAQREFRQIYPQPGWVEHDPREIAETQLEVAAEAVAKVRGADIVAIGITNQRETTILWDRTTGEPAANAIVWQDRRTAPLCDELRAEGYEMLFCQRTGLVLDPYFSGTKIRWLLDHVDVDPDRLAFGTVDSWLIWKLTGGRAHVTDVTNASRTLLFDI